MKTDFSKEFGKKLEKLMKRRGLSRQQLAESLDCSSITVRHWIHGEIPYSIHALKKLRELYGVDLNRLLKGGN